MKFDLSIIIVSYNTKDLLVDCINSIGLSKQGLKTQVIVVDNNSIDGSVEAVKNLKNKVEQLLVIENKVNFGFSKANNIGIKKALGRYVLFLNSDTKLEEKTLPGMVSFMDSHPDCDIATCKLMLPDGSIDDASHRGFPTPWRAFCHFSGISKLAPNSQLFNGYHLGWKYMDSVHEIEACAGAFMMVRPQIGKNINWWDEDYFWYGEDLDFCYCAKQKGAKICYVPDYSCLHYKGASGGIKKSSSSMSSADEETKKLAQNARFEAMRIFYRKHYKKKYPGFVTSFVMAGIRLKQFIS